MPMDANIRQSVQSLAVDITECGDEELAWRLLSIGDMLNDCRNSQKALTAAHNELWKFGLVETCVEALRQDFDNVRDGWNTAARLTDIVSRCCRVLPREEEQKSIAVLLLPVATESILVATNTIQENFIDGLNDRTKVESKQLLENFRMAINSVTSLCDDYPELIVRLLKSPILLHMTITDNVDTARLLLVMIRSLLDLSKRNLSMSGLTQDDASNLLDELVFKISSTQEPIIACAAMKVMLAFTDVIPSLGQFYVAQYSSLIPLISKWRNEGFDDDVRRLLNMLEEDREEEVRQMVRNKAASAIQSLWRGYKTRQKMDTMKQGILKLQRLVRRKQQMDREMKEQEKLSNLEKQLKEDKYRQEMRSSLHTQLQLLEHVPAQRVDSFIAQREERAAVVLQSQWRGLMARRKAAKQRVEQRRQKAAVCIQKNMRQYLKKKRPTQPRYQFSFLLDGLSDTRRTELQKKIDAEREKYPYKYTSMDELRGVHEKAQRMMGEFLVNSHKEMQKDTHRRALVAQLQSDVDQLLNAPKLDDVTGEDLDAFTSVSGPVAKMAQRAHVEELKAMRLPWWKRVPLDQDIDLSELGMFYGTDNV